MVEAALFTAELASPLQPARWRKFGKLYWPTKLPLPQTGIQVTSIYSKSYDPTNQPELTKRPTTSSYWRGSRIDNGFRFHQTNWGFTMHCNGFSSLDFCEETFLSWHWNGKINQFSCQIYHLKWTKWYKISEVRRLRTKARIFIN